ncbi:MAG: phosphoribosyl-AMP cyclohydrolase [Candidatus Diapherotrites archaeon]|uniref:Phosphoribosyl-AMP cyclohydrolase n=1 Tax=Candidatus Iainarchaeum sp. TaxID=3101447 RepID=A0A8T4LCB5_9ARCH|nr:phosphoribosyl-AMP cyclohydrolase [Candidatus Diapherotrites archaeon]
MIIPAIDLMDGKAVQLVGGREKKWESTDVDGLAERFKGFREVQVIDLDAALREGSNLETVQALCWKVRARVGGGIDSVEKAVALVEAGAKKVIVGSKAEKGFLSELAGVVGREKVVAALDSKDGRIVVKGWKEATSRTPEELLPELEDYCGEFMATFVEVEGRMAGFDFGRVERLARLTRNRLVYAGGVSSLAEVARLDWLGVDAVVGMALYEGRISVEDALAFNRLDFGKGRGLIPAVVQDAGNGEVLMLAYVSRASLEKTLREGKACYWSRSRKALWTKGETSGNFQRVREVRFDCDADALLFRVEQTGNACHTNQRSCFFGKVEERK